MADIMIDSAKNRSSNLTAADKERILELVIKYRSVLENKQTDATNAQLKEAAWKALAKEFNATGSSARTHQQLKQVGRLFDHDMIVEAINKL